MFKGNRRLVQHLSKTETARGMGPGVRRDDSW